jgi:hypothetical protein
MVENLPVNTLCNRPIGQADSYDFLYQVSTACNYRVSQLHLRFGDMRLHELLTILYYKLSHHVNRPA